MGKPKTMLSKKSAKPQKGKPAPLRTPDDFQQAADVEEETGGKWRAGDQAKSARAFQRAIQIYNDGLQKHPKNFDLAYNKARLELELSQQSALVSKLPVSLLEFLQQVLESHRYALRLNEENADILFNTAQVMISIAENYADGGSGAEGVPLLHEALEILSACFSRQEMLREEQNMNFSEDVEGGVPLDSEPMQDEQTKPPAAAAAAAAAPESDSDVEEAEEESATIQAFITIEDLLDTSRASLTALTLLVTFSEPRDLPNLSQMASNLSDTTIPTLLNQLTPEEQQQTSPEVSLERAEFISTLATAEFKSTTIPLPSILARLEIFPAQFNLRENVPAMCIYADALVELCSTAIVFSTDPALAPLCWAQLSKAQDLYAAAVKLANNPDSRDRKAQIYESRADVEMLRFRLAAAAGDVAGLSASVRASAPTLVKNAGVYYRGAGNLFRADGEGVAAAKAEIRGLIAAVVEAKATNVDVVAKVALLRQRGDGAAAVSVEMVREGLLGQEWDGGLE